MEAENAVDIINLIKRMVALRKQVDELARGAIMAVDQQERVLEAVRDLDKKLEDFKAAYQTNLIQGRTEAAQNSAAKDSQTVINAQLREADIGLKEAVHGDGNKGLQEKGRDQERATSALETKVDDLTALVKGQTSIWGKLGWLGVGILLSLLASVVLLALNLATHGLAK